VRLIGSFDCLSPLGQTPWEGGVYKLVMTFPEGELSLAFPQCSDLFQLDLNADVINLVSPPDYPSKPPKCAHPSSSHDLFRLSPSPPFALLPSTSARLSPKSPLDLPSPSMIHFTQANTPLLSSTPTSTRPEPSVSQFLMRRKHGSRLSLSSRYVTFQSPDPPSFGMLTLIALTASDPEWCPRAPECAERG
jgi:hypothetical protein